MITFNRNMLPEIQTWWCPPTVLYQPLTYSGASFFAKPPENFSTTPMPMPPQPIGRNRAAVTSLVISGENKDSSEEEEEEEEEEGPSPRLPLAPPGHSLTKAPELRLLLSWPCSFRTQQLCFHQHGISSSIEQLGTHPTTCRQFFFPLNLLPYERECRFFL